MIAALMLAAMLTDPAGVMSTAPADAGHVPLAEAVPAVPQEPPPHGLTTAQQIDRWLAGPPQAAVEGGAVWADEPEPRRIHGQVGVGIGTHDYRSIEGEVSVPIGDEGWINLYYRDAKSDLPAGYWDRNAYPPRGPAFDAESEW